MSYPTRAEHMEWCKQRALRYLERGELGEAVASMTSDLSKHPETQQVGDRFGSLGILAAMSGDAHAIREWIEGF